MAESGPPQSEEAAAGTSIQPAAMIFSAPLTTATDTRQALRCAQSR